MWFLRKLHAAQQGFTVRFGFSSCLLVAEKILGLLKFHNIIYIYSCVGMATTYYISYKSSDSWKYSKSDNDLPKDNN